MKEKSNVPSEILKATTTLLSSRVSNLSAAELLSTLETYNEVFARGQKKTKKGHRALFFELEQLDFQVFQRT